MEGKKKRKLHFINQAHDHKKRRRLSLECGMKGFLCTCNFREKDCVREAYNLLNEYVDQICNTNEKQIIDNTPEICKNDNVNNVEGDKEEEEKDTDDEEDISTAFNKEIEELKAEVAKPASEKLFQVVDTGVNNLIFIKSKIPNTLELVSAIIKDLIETKKQKTRYLLRMVPIQITCKAYLDDIRTKADTLFEQYFSQEPKTFCIVFNRHSNSNLVRNEVIDDLAQIIMKKNPGNKANLKNPDIAVVVEVVRALCLISIAPNYFTYKKYNLLEICNKK